MSGEVKREGGKWEAIGFGLILIGIMLGIGGCVKSSVGLCIFGGIFFMVGCIVFLVGRFL